MDTRAFFMKSLMVLCCGHEGESTLTHIWYPPFFGAALWGTGMSYRTSPILGLPWMLFQLPTSFPSVTPGCCERTQSPLADCSWSPRGEAGSAQRNPAVRVLGQGSSSSLSQAMKHKRLSGRRERSRGTRHPQTVWTVFFIRG